MTTTVPKLLAGGVTAALLAAGLAASTPAYAATTCTSGVPGDVNGDGYAEVAVGQRRPPSVNVFYGHPSGLQVNAKGSARNDQVFSQSTRGVPGSTATHDGFGRSTTFGDFNGDGCADLAIGNPDDDRDGASVTVLYGSPRGLTTAGVVRLQPTGAPFDDWYLAGLGAKLGSGDLTGDGVDDLVASIPGAIDVGSDVGDGALVVFTGGSAGLSDATGRRMPVSGADVFGPGAEASVDDFAVGDFDGNGLRELAVSTRGTSVVTFGPSGIVSVQRDVVDDGGLGLVVGDTNGDRRDDLAFTADDDGDSVVLLFGSGTGLGPTNSRAWTGAELGLDEFWGLTVAMGPLDSDSTDDLVVGGPGTVVAQRSGRAPSPCCSVGWGARHRTTSSD